MKNHKTKKIKSLTVYIIVSLSLVIIYTSVVTVLKAITGQDFSAEYITFCGVFGGEVVTCGLIKIFKLKREGDFLCQTSSTDLEI